MRHCRDVICFLKNDVPKVIFIIIYNIYYKTNYEFERERERMKKRISAAKK